MTKCKDSQGNVSKPKISLWQKIKNVFFCGSKKAKVLQDNPLAQVKIEDLELEKLEKNLTEPEVEIAFINPTTGELEVIHLPQNTFKIRLEESSNPEDEPVVMLELEMPALEIDEEDPINRITHFPPSSRLH